MDEAGAGRCLICDGAGLEGIVLRGKLICAACERRLVAAKVGSFLYPYYVDRLREVWQHSGESEQRHG